MNRQGHENVQFFYGTEIERTPAYGQYTLFVVGVQSLDDIAAALTNGSQPVEHIYFGANMSFPQLSINDIDGWRPWETMIRSCLDLGYTCTLDLDVASVEGLLEGGLTEHMNFIPMISVKLPYLQQLGFNATIKLDDKDFAATNFGVWCHSLHSLTNRDNFTAWREYSKDEV